MELKKKRGSGRNKIKENWSEEKKENYKRRIDNWEMRKERVSRINKIKKIGGEKGTRIVREGKNENQ